MISHAGQQQTAPQGPVRRAAWACNRLLVALRAETGDCAARRIFRAALLGVMPGRLDRRDPGAATVDGHRHRHRHHAGSRPGDLGGRGFLHLALRRQPLSGRRAGRGLHRHQRRRHHQARHRRTADGDISRRADAGRARPLLRLGTYIKYVPGPVILGFTSGIGLIIAIGQIKDMLGLKGDVPADVLHKICRALGAARQRSIRRRWRSASARSP